MILLGLDPGTVNFGYSVIKVDEDQSHLKESYVEHPEILEHGLLTQIILYSNADDLDRELMRGAVSEILEICIRNGVDRIAIERWAKRPGQAVPMWVERLNHVIGAIIYSSAVPIKAIMASSWKRRILNRYGIKSTKTYFQGAVKTEHAGDASMIALYLHEFLLEAKIEAARPKRVRKKTAAAV
jgi:Holliday junction resolvasome RuvABC endonuclease subunit